MSNNKNKTRSFSMRSKFQIQERPRRQWTVVQEFGKVEGGLNGGIAKVELKDDPIDRFFIEKRFPERHVPDENYAAKEISLMYQLQDHENIVKMVDHFLNKKMSKASIYMEFCDAGDLQDVVRAVVLQKQHVPERTVWEWFIGCMDALAYVHYGPKPDDHVFSKKYWNQIYHRDLKPANVFLKRDNQKKQIVAKLADFGCSISDQFTKLNKSRSYASMTSALTPGFDPPEHPDFSVVTDVWQMALCIVCVCTGIFDPRSKSHTTGVQWDEKQPAGEQYTRELNDVLKWCLTVDLKRRPNSWEVLKRLREKYSQVKDSLPYDDRRMDMFWKPRIDEPPDKAQHPASSPGPRAVDPQHGYQEHRPGLSGHAFSDPGVEGMHRMGNRYTDMVKNDRRAMSPNTINEIVNGGGGYGQSGTPSGYGPSGTSGGYGQFGAAEGYGQSDIQGGYSQSGLQGGYGQPDMSGGYGQPDLPGGFVPGFGRGFGQGGGSGGYFGRRSGRGWR